VLDDLGLSDLTGSRLIQALRGWTDRHYLLSGRADSTTRVSRPWKNEGASYVPKHVQHGGTCWAPDAARRAGAHTPKANPAAGPLGDLVWPGSQAGVPPPRSLRTAEAGPDKSL